MKTSLLIASMFLTTTVFGQTKTVTVRGHKFNLKTRFVDNDSGGPIEQLELYRGNTRLLVHTISKLEGDCNSESIEVGVCEVADTTVSFYSYWTRAGDAPASPFGVRKQIYLVDKNGYVRLIKAEVYVEVSRTLRSGWAENKGIKYLFSIPKNESEKKQMKEYITEVEQAYNGKFTLGRSKVLLFAEVRTKLKRQIQAATKDLERVYTDRLGGYKL